MTRRSRLRTSLNQPAPARQQPSARDRQIEHLVDALAPSERAMALHAHCMLDPRDAEPVRSSLGFPGESQVLRITSAASMVVGTDGFATFSAIPTVAGDDIGILVSTATTVSGGDVAAATNMASVGNNSPYLAASFAANNRRAKFVAAAVYIKYSGRADELAGKYAAKVSDFNGVETAYEDLREADGSYVGTTGTPLVLPWFPHSAAVCDPVPTYRWPLTALTGGALGGSLSYDNQVAKGVFAGTAGSSFDFELVVVAEISGPSMAPVTTPPSPWDIPHPSALPAASVLAHMHLMDHRERAERGGGTPWYRRVWDVVRAITSNPLVRQVGNQLGGQAIQDLSNLARGRNVPASAGRLAASAARTALPLLTL